ncbi:hypothetical protein U6X16_00100 [Bacillus velezensis]|uniref:hypothetical protein n=1 Tax=Bacillus amyloliquefaciens group TaxID=1938374 RepID=UPI000A49DBA3|nr:MULTISPECIES: hypothetical protein [Bacillus amyloliquefaciens group]MEA1004103.1 hypothetical protein [Bacillus velezensis]
MYLALFFTLIDARRLLLPFTAVAFAVARVIDAFGILQISFASSTSPCHGISHSAAQSLIHFAQLKKPGCIRVFQAID